MGLYCNLVDCTAVVSLQKPQNDNIGGSNTLNFIHSNLFNAAAAVICTDCTVVTERLVNKRVEQHITSSSSCSTQTLENTARSATTRTAVIISRTRSIAPECVRTREVDAFLMDNSTLIDFDLIFVPLPASYHDQKLGHTTYVSLSSVAENRRFFSPF